MKMTKKCICNVIIFVFCVSTIYAQTSPCSGKMLTPEGTVTVCFTQKTYLVDTKTQYFITLNGSEIYEINFIYYSDVDSMAINFYDKQSTRTDRRFVKFDRRDSHVIIKNYEKNQKSIEDSLYDILFSINESDNFVTLYNFSAIGGSETQFNLLPVTASVLARHREKVKDYDDIIAKQRKKQREVEDYKQSMLNYKDSIIQALVYLDSVNRTKKATLIANDNLKAEFFKIVDPIFFNYFKNVYLFTNDNFEVDFPFYCNGNGVIKMDTSDIPIFKSSGVKKWVIDSINLKIKPIIESKRFNTITEFTSNLDFKKGFLARFDRVEDLDQQKTELRETRDLILKVFEEIEKRKISIPTKYTYSFKYESIAVIASYKYKGDENGDGTFKAGKSTADPTDEELVVLRTKIYTPGVKNYNVQICTITVNDKRMIPSIRKL